MIIIQQYFWKINFYKKTLLCCLARAAGRHVNRLGKRSVNDCFPICFQSSWTFRKRITIVFEIDRFLNDKPPFLIRLYFTKRSLTIANEGLSLSYILEKVVRELKLLDILFKTTQWLVPMPFRSVSSLR